jgi:hypothetical protein
VTVGIIPTVTGTGHNVQVLYQKSTMRPWSPLRRQLGPASVLGIQGWGRGGGAIQEGLCHHMFLVHMGQQHVVWHVQSGSQCAPSCAGILKALADPADTSAPRAWCDTQQDA